jgi:hypothetical protein
MSVLPATAFFFGAAVLTVFFAAAFGCVLPVLLY